MGASVETPVVLAVDVTGVPYYFDRNTGLWREMDVPGKGAKIVSPGRLGIVAQDRDGDFYVRYSTHIYFLTLLNEKFIDFGIEPGFYFPGTAF